jgi:hypothetical protein
LTGVLVLSVLVAVSTGANGTAMLAGRKPAATDGVRELNGELDSEDPRISARGDTEPVKPCDSGRATSDVETSAGGTATNIAGSDRTLKQLLTPISASEKPIMYLARTLTMFLLMVLPLVSEGDTYRFRIS